MSNYTNSTNSFYKFIHVQNQKQQPLDSVQSICIDPYYRGDQQRFLVGGWDGFVRYYRIIPKHNQEIELSYSRFLQHPVITLSMNQDSMAFAGLATGQIVAVDMPKDQSGVIGSHDAPICKIFWIEKFNLLMSLGFDNKIKFWTLQNGNNFLAKQYQLPRKTHTAAFDFPYLMIGSIDSKITFINLNNLPNITIPDVNGYFDVIEIGSKINCCKIVANSRKYTFGCVDGRCSLGSFEETYQGIRPVTDSSDGLKLTSKAMKKQSSYSTSPIYGQVNDVDIGYENNRPYWVIGGSEEVSFFNVHKKDKPKRIKSKCTAAKLSLDGKYLIYAEGTDWSEGMGDLKKCVKTKVQAVKFTKSQLESFVVQK